MAAKSLAPHTSGSASPPTAGGKRAFSGLALVFVLSFINLVGIFFTVMALGGLGDWTPWHFIGLYGVFEAASGLSNVVVPNIWRLPVAAVQTSARVDVKLAASAMLIPHWGGLARAVAGLVLIGAAATHAGIGLLNLSVLPLVLLTAVLFTGFSAPLARLGVARPDLDVIQFVIDWRDRERELPPISITASFLQLAFSLVTIPAIKVLSPGILYGDQMRASQMAILATLVATVLCTVATVLAWKGRVGVEAPREQQAEAERNA